MRTLGLLLCLLCGAPALADEGARRHKIVSEDGAGPERSIAVRIDQRAPEADIKALAFTLRDKAKPGKAPAVVRFYLSGMALSDAPWAVMRFDEGAHLDISGLRHEEVQAFTAEAAADTRDIQGVWLTSAPALPGKLTIWRTSKGERFAEWHLRTGKKTIDELMEVKTPRGRRYEIKGSDGGYYLATWAGPLELGEGKAVIATAERLVIPKDKPAAAAAAPAPTAKAQDPLADKMAAPPARSPASPQQAAAAVAAEAADATAPVTQPKPRRKRVIAKPSPRPLNKGDSVAEAIRETMSR